LFRDLTLSNRVFSLFRDFLSGMRQPWIVNKIPTSEVVVRDISTDEEISLTKFQAQARTVLKEDLLREWEGLIQQHPWTKSSSSAARLAAVEIFSRLVSENLVFNSVETNQRKADLSQNVQTAWAEVQAGELIAKEGERLSKREILLLDAQREALQTQFHWKGTLGFAAVLFLLANILYVVGRRNFKKFRLSMRDQIVMGSFLILSMALIAGLKHLFEAARLQSTVGQSLIFLLPLGFSGMTLRLFSSMEITTFFVLLFSLAVGWLLNDPYFALIALASGLAGAARMRRIQQRFDVFKAGLVSGGVAALFALTGILIGAINSAPSLPSALDWGLIPAFSFLAGFFNAALILAIQPALEQMGYTTDLRLMELSRTDHPLLRDLILKAPGTYFHSFTVSQLAEKAADACYANSLFARVASLYHDIGKTKKPQYFIENIKGDNKHDKLAPTMSALIISNHVKDGIELGLEHKLPLSIIEIIPQHHGTSLISYFYDKAKKASPSEDIREDDFRYPGPKPQTKEAAIILMADAVEATAKTMANASEDQLNQMVHKTIQRFFLDGQLDECDLSLKDLSAIGRAFVQVLLGVYHHRIDYPHLKKSEDEPTITLHKMKPRST
jgi:putative nucleotidyltransferase with HDIG domain